MMLDSYSFSFVFVFCLYIIHISNGFNNKNSHLQLPQQLARLPLPTCMLAKDQHDIRRYGASIEGAIKQNSLRNILVLSTCWFISSNPSPAHAVTALSENLAAQLQKLQEVQNALDAADVPFTELKSGVSYREFRNGRGSTVVEPGSTVAVEMSVRCKSLKTAKEPGGVQYFSTKEDMKDSELVWKIGAGTFLPELEEAMLGMKRGSLRRIEIPSVAVFKARNAGQLPVPSARNQDGQRRFVNLFKTDATLLFEILVKSIDEPVVDHL